MSYIVYSEENRIHKPYSYRALRIAYRARNEEGRNIINRQKVGVRFIEPVSGRINPTSTKDNCQRKNSRGVLLFIEN